jgi:hypothetical protein
MIHENDGHLDEDASQVGCYCLGIAAFDPTITDEQFNQAWETAKAKTILDENDVLIDPQGFVDLLGLKLKYRMGFWPPGTLLDPPNQHIIGKWTRPNPKDTKNPITHFVVMDGKGTDKTNVVYDPIDGGSRTVREGSFDSYRIFDKV